MPLPALASTPSARRCLLAAIAGATTGVLLGALAGCSPRTRYTPPTSPLPPNTVLLSDMMQGLSARPGFTEALLAHIDKGSRKGPALLTPQLADTLRGLILGKDWAGLNRFPGWTMREINPTVRVVGHVVGKDAAAEGLANPGKGATTAPANSALPPPAARRAVTSYIDLGPYTLDHQGSADHQTVDLDQPSILPGFAEAARGQGSPIDLGAGVTRGDGPDPNLAPTHAESARLAFVLNRLSLNALEDTPRFTANLGGRRATTPEQLIEALTATGHTVTVVDARYFANFGHFHYAAHGSANPAQDVMMPFWVNTEITVPGANRPLLIPVSHTEYEWFIRGPRMGAAVAFYFGIDGKAEFRTMDERNQPWVLNRHAHTYTGPEALEVTRLTGRMVLAYIHQHLRRPAIPFGGYYALGVCQDAVAAIEKKMTGEATLFPNTADAALFDDPRDAEVNQLIAAIPKDRTGDRPEPQRIFGSLPTDNLRAITIPGLADDLLATEAAWQAGTLQHTHGPRYWTARALEALGVTIAALVVYRLRRRPRSPSRQSRTAHQ